MSKASIRPPVKFEQVFRDELAAINFRRQELLKGNVTAARRARQPAGGGAPSEPVAPDIPYAVERHSAEMLDAPTPGGNAQVSDTSTLTGLALSGGGMRSASFSLGVLQALDSLAANDRPQVIDALDYISTVSGGGYIGTSLVAGMMDGDHSFPFTSRLDSEETPEVQHLRDYSSFLAPNGFFDLIIGVVFIVRGLLVNALIVLPFLLLLAALTVFSNPTIASLDDPDVIGFSVSGASWLPHIPGLAGFTLTASVALMAAIVLVISAFVFDISSLRRREQFGWALAWVVVFVGIVAIFEAQPFVLKALVCAEQTKEFEFAECPAAPTRSGASVSSPDNAAAGGGAVAQGAPDAGALGDAAPVTTPSAEQDPIAAAADAAGDTPLGALLQAIGTYVPKIGTILGPVLLLLISFGQKLVNVAMATVGDDRKAAIAARLASMTGLGVAAIVVPLVMWIAYLYLCVWAVSPSPPGPQLECGPLSPEWLQVVSSCGHSWIAGITRGNAIAALYLLAGFLMLAVWLLLLGPNVNTLHRYYRDRLSRAFLIDRDNPAERKSGWAHRTTVDTKTFESLKPIKAADKDKPITAKSFEAAAAFAPYLLVNTAINIEGSEALNRRGRNADTFLFSPLYVGSHSTRYAREPDLRLQVPDLTLGTAMAVSGAAASANMGRLTIRPLVFSLALLNVRLGYWLANPGRLDAFRNWMDGVRSNAGLWFFGQEALGTLDERGLQVYLTDGGHVENLGVYELIRRRCKVVIAVDVDLDPLMNFPSLVNLEMMARIDLGARIEVPWRDLKKVGTAITDTDLHGPEDNADYPDCHGPHAAIGIIRYDGSDSQKDIGVLIHIKTMLTGDENDYILDYKRRNSTFPHETTIDQFYDEEQFEVYRALGFHAARQLFTGEEPAAHLQDPPEGWSGTVAEALQLLNIPQDMIAKVIARMKKPNAAGDAEAVENAGETPETAAERAPEGAKPKTTRRRKPGGGTG